MARILIADRNLHFSTSLQHILKKHLWDVEIAKDGREALNGLCAKYFDVLILDLAVAEAEGSEVMRVIQQEGLGTAVVMIAEHPTVDKAVQAIKSGAQEFIHRSTALADFIYIVSRVLERRHYSPHCLANRLDLFIREHCGHASLRLSDLCKHFSISPSYVFQLLQQHIGISFRKRLAYYRVQKAKILIESTDQPLYLIAEQCGFKNQGRLTEAFNRIEGIAPRRYRETFKG